MSYQIGIRCAQYAGNGSLDKRMSGKSKSASLEIDNWKRPCKVGLSLRLEQRGQMHQAQECSLGIELRVQSHPDQQSGWVSTLRS